MKTDQDFTDEYRSTGWRKAQRKALKSAPRGDISRRPKYPGSPRSGCVCHGLPIPRDTRGDRTLPRARSVVAVPLGDGTFSHGTRTRPVSRPCTPSPSAPPWGLSSRPRAAFAAVSDPSARAPRPSASRTRSLAGRQPLADASSSASPPRRRRALVLPPPRGPARASSRLDRDSQPSCQGRPPATRVRARRRRTYPRRHPLSVFPTSSSPSSLSLPRRASSAPPFLRRASDRLLPLGACSIRLPSPRGLFRPN